jgi:hypothetical protein
MPLTSKLPYWPTTTTFVGGYLPILASKGFNIIWTSIFVDTQNHAPISLLLSGNGVSGSALFGTLDTPSYIALVPYIASWLIVPISAGAITFDTTYCDPNGNQGQAMVPCWPPKMTVNPTIIRLTQTLLSVIAVFSAILIAYWFKRPKSLSSDPTSIAGIASLAGHPEVARDFNCGLEASNGELKKRIENKRYSLAEYRQDDGAVRYGLVPLKTESSARRTDSIPSERGDNSKKEKTWFGVIPKGWKDKLMYMDGLFLLYMIGMLVIVALSIASLDDYLVIFMFRQDTIPKKILFAAIAAVVSIYVGRTERGTSSSKTVQRLTGFRYSNSRSIYGSVNIGRSPILINHPPKTHHPLDIILPSLTPAALPPSASCLYSTQLRVSRCYTLWPSIPVCASGRRVSFVRSLFYHHNQHDYSMCCGFELLETKEDPSSSTKAQQRGGRDELCM